jgi:stage V sporulation protein G
MKISDIRIRKVDYADNKTKAVASFTIDDCFIVHDIRIIDGAKGLFVAMPRRKTSTGDYKDIVHPADTATRNSIEAQILEAFELLKKTDL